MPYTRLRSLVDTAVQQGYAEAETEVGTVSVAEWSVGTCRIERDKRTLEHAMSSCYHPRPSSLVDKAYITLRRSYPGGWSEDDHPCHETLNEFDAKRETMSDAEAAATLLHEIAHHLTGDPDATNFENEVAAWAKARTLWRKCGYEARFPQDRAADALSTYAA